MEDERRENESKSRGSPTENMALDESKIIASDHKLCGDLAFKEKRYLEAIESYKLSFAETSDRKEAAVVLGNIAECYLQMRKYAEALEHAKRSIEYDDLWKSHLCCGKAFTEIGNFEGALQKYVKAWESSQSFSDRAKITIQIALLANKSGPWCLENLHFIPFPVWIHAAYVLMVNKNWQPSSLAYNEVPYGSRTEKRYSLRPFYDLCVVRTRPWTMEFMQFLLDNGSDLSTLTDGPDDNCLHAYFRMLLNTDFRGGGRIINTVMKSIARKSDLTTDTSGNSLFHLIVREGSHNTARQLYLCDLLFRIKLAGLLLSGDKQQKRPIYYVENKRGPLYHMLLSVMQKLGDTATTDVNQEMRQAEEMILSGRNKIQGLQLLIKQLKRKNLTLAEEDLALNCILSNLTVNDCTEVAMDIIKLPMKIFRKIMRYLIKTQNWRTLCYLHKEFKRKNPGIPLTFAADFNIFDFIHSTKQLTEEEEVATLRALHDAGSSKSGKEGRDAMVQLIANDRHLPCLFLMEIGLSPTFYCTGEISPIFLATRFALKRGNSEILEFLLNKYSKRKKEYPYLDPNKVDKDGYSLFHHVCLSDGPIQNAKNVASVLAKHKVSATVADSKGKEAKDYLTKDKEELMKFVCTQKVQRSKGCPQAPIRETYDSSKRTKEKTTTQAQAETNEFIKQSNDQMFTGTPRKKEGITEEQNTTSNVLKVSREQTTTTVQQTPPQKEESGEDLSQSFSKERDKFNDTGNEVQLNDEVVRNEYEESPVVMSDSAEETDSAGDEETRDDDHLETEPFLKDVEELEEEINRGIKSIHSQDPVSVKQKEDAILQQKKVKERSPRRAVEIPLDRLMESVWQVEITSEVEKALTDASTRLSGRAIEEAVIAMTKLADMNKNINSQRIDAETPYQLYELCLSDREKMIFEKAVTYSVRDNFKTCMDSDDHPKIYSEVIRIWYVTPNKQFDKCVQKIIKVYKHSQHCTRPRKLLLRGQKQASKSRDERFPKLYTTKEETLPSRYDIEFAPPAISKRGEFNLIRFKEFTTEFAKFVLRNVEKEVSFPFKVFEQEHVIIEMTTERPIVLQGRSGTGKTTCCLYRLWKQFATFWDPIYRKQDVTGVPDTSNAENQRLAETTILDFSKLEKQTIDAMKSANEEIYEEERLEESQTVAEDSFEDLESDVDNDSQQQHAEFTQIFITKNHHLCHQVQGQFRLLLNSKDWSEAHTLASKQPLPHTFGDIDSLQYPLFLSSRQLLLMLDASLPPPYFFDRDEDMDLQYEVPGWTYATSVLDLDDSDDEQDDETTKSDPKSSEANSAKMKLTKVRSRKRREVTYEVFEKEIWQKIRHKTKKVIKCHPSIVWKEIVSFIKGSYECMTKHRKGVLPFEDYVKIGRKKAPDFDENDREIVYDLFTLYEKHKRKNGLFDEMDVVRCIHARMTDENMEMIKFQQIYVDETQDFTQAELWLLLRLCQSPNQMFLAGDTAQAIMHGISFRFADLVSLFKFYEVECKENGHGFDVTAPRKPYQLCENYRSHNGVLNLAASVLDIILEYFEESVDRLGRDIGMYRGTKPAIVHCENEEDLIMLLNNNKRVTSKVEFGAHQAILVLNEAEKETMPKEFDKAIKLTIYEAKGLEFDDVLIYNFFKSSQIDHQKDKQMEKQCRWPIVTTFLKKLLETPNEELMKKQIHIDKGFKDKQLPRGKDYDPKQDRALCTLLKQLYTAISRARVNVWIYDSDEEQRQHMYLYFRARGLVETITKDNFEERTFAKKTSRDEWIKQGDKMMEKGLYLEAAKCFKNGRDASRVTVALARYQMSTAGSEKDSIKKRHLYLDAANRFLQCRCPKYRQNNLASETSNICQCQKNAIRCFRRAKRKDLLAKFLEEIGEFQRAGEIYQKLKKPLESARCFKEVRRFDLAVEILHESQMFIEAKSTCAEYKIQVEKPEKEEQVPLYAPESFYSEDFFTYKEAEQLHQLGQRQKVVECLRSITDIEGAVDFLLQRDYIDEALNLLYEENLLDRACTMSLKYGMVQQATSLARLMPPSRGHVLVAKCLLTIIKLNIRDSRQNIIPYDSLSTSLKQTLSEACSIFDYDCKKNCSGEAYLLLGMTKKNIKIIGRAFAKFSQAYPKNIAGMLECMEWMVFYADLTIWKPMTQVILGMENLANIVNILTNNDTYADKNTMDSILEFYGFHRHEDDALVELYPPHKSFYLLTLNKHDFPRNNRPVILNKRAICERLVEHLTTRGMSWDEKLRQEMTRHRLIYLRCPSYEFGCSNCEHAHKRFSAREHGFLILTDLWYMAMEYYGNTCPGLYSKQSFQSIRCFVDDFMNIFSRSDFLESIRWVKRIFNQKFYRKFLTNEPYIPHIKEMVVSYIECRQREIGLDNCSLSSEVLMDILLLYNLFELQGFANDVPISAVRQFESHATKQLQTGKTTIKDLKRQKFILKLSDAKSSSERSKLRIKCMVHVFYDAVDQLLRLNDPLEALQNFIQFARHIPMANVYLTEKTNVLSWIEYMMTIGLVHLARVIARPVVLPTSYLVNLEVLDAVFHRTEDVLFTLSSFQPKYPALYCKKRMSVFSEILIDILGSFKRIFEWKDFASMTILRRLLIVNMIYLCNTPLVSRDTENALIKVLFSMKKSILPECPLKEAVCKLNEARNQREMYFTLCDLVEGDGDGLYLYNWTSNGKLEKTQSDIYAIMSECSYLVEANLQDFEQTESTDKEVPKFNDITEIDETERTENTNVYFDVLTDAQERAARKYGRRWSFYTKLRHLKQTVIRYRNNELKKRTEAMFADVIVDEDVCGICGVEFSDKGPESSMSDRDRETHCKRDQHIQKERDFNAFMDVFMSVISKRLFSTEQCIDRYNLTTKQSLTNEVESQRRNVVRLFTDMKGMIESIHESRSWGNLEPLFKASHDLENETQAVLSYIRREKGKKREREKKQMEDREKLHNRRERDKLLYGDESSDDEDVSTDDEDEEILYGRMR